jgi:RNA polymerase sigma-70 factor (ECF subfamily)
VSPTFEDFYRRELVRLIGLARGLCGSGPAEDLAQEAMLAAFRRWNTVRSLDAPDAWVRRVCINICTSHIRRRVVETKALLRLSARPTTHQDEPEHEDFWREVRRLPRRQSQAVALRAVYDMSIAEIAATMGVTEGSAKVHLSRARTRLAERLRISDPGEAP